MNGLNARHPPGQWPLLPPARRLDRVPPESPAEHESEPASAWLSTRQLQPSLGFVEESRRRPHPSCGASVIKAIYLGEERHDRGYATGPQTPEARGRSPEPPGIITLAR